MYGAHTVSAIVKRVYRYALLLLIIVLYYERDGRSQPCTVGADRRVL